MSTTRKAISEQEFAGIVKSGAADFIAKACGYTSVEELWASRGTSGALLLNRGPEMRQHVASYIHGLSTHAFELTVKAGHIAALARYTNGGNGQRVELFMKMRDRVPPYRGKAERSSFAQRVGYTPASDAIPTATKVKVISAKTALNVAKADRVKSVKAMNGLKGFVISPNLRPSDKRLSRLGTAAGRLAIAGAAA